jgi:hypothetical protein
MTVILDLFATAVQYGSLAALVYGAIYSLEVDVLIDRALKTRPARALVPTV